MAKGDRLFFFSDGLIENYHGRNISRKEGMQRLEESLVTRHGLPLAAMVEETAQSICGSNENPGDDLLHLVEPRGGAAEGRVAVDHQPVDVLQALLDEPLGRGVNGLLL